MKIVITDDDFDVYPFLEQHEECSRVRDMSLHVGRDGRTKSIGFRIPKNMRTATGGFAITVENAAKLEAAIHEIIRLKCGIV